MQDRFSGGSRQPGRDRDDPSAQGGAFGDGVGVAGKGSGGVKLTKLNLGNVHFGSGRKQVSPSVYLDANEMAQRAQLASAGIEIEARAVPAETPTPLQTLQERFKK